MQVDYDDIEIPLGSNLLIIGYPGGKSSGGGWPIWKTGHLATDIGIDYDERPVFLIDGNTKGGMSGSPVIADLGNTYKQNNSQTTITQVGGSVRLFLGVYAGRIEGNSINEEATQIDIGKVFKRHALVEMLDFPTVPDVIF